GPITAGASTAGGAITDWGTLVAAARLPLVLAPNVFGSKPKWPDLESVGFERSALVLVGLWVLSVDGGFDPLCLVPVPSTSESATRYCRPARSDTTTDGADCDGYARAAIAPAPPPPLS